MARKRFFPRRGSVYQVRFDPAFGHEIRKTRPAVVISNDHMNELAATVLVMPITTGNYPYYHWINIDPRKVDSLARPRSSRSRFGRSIKAGCDED